MSAAPVSAPRILLADDHPAMLKAVTGMVVPHFDVVAAVNDGTAALDAAARTDPDVVLSDIMMPGLDGISTARELKRRESRAKVVFLSAQEDDDYISEALDVGAQGYIVKRRMQSDLIPALNLALGGHYFISPHAFDVSVKNARKSHTLEFYLEENGFFQRAAELTRTALIGGEAVSMFLSKAGLHFVRQRLSAWGLNYMAAIERGQYQVYSVENNMPSLMIGNYPSPAFFESFFCPFWKRAASCARERGSKLTIISDMIAALLQQGYGHEVAANVEEVWNDIIPQQSCVVYCGCPVTNLSSKENRLTLSRICGQHSKVTPINS